MKYDKQLLEAIKEELLESFGDSEEDALNEMRRYRDEFPNEPDYNIYRYGNIRPYYSQIRDLFVSHNMPNIPDDNESMCVIFCQYIGKATDQLLKERGIK